ncbi:TolC family protein [Oleiharenicola lentus]|uniref:TolC family protein n=1 Tax=Oleiharenicola lentus TaxID=2508720 RepID=UPI003F6708A6
MKFLSLPLFLLLATPLLPSDDQALSFDDALARTAARNPHLLALSGNERAAAALIEQAGVRPNPVLGVTLENFAGTGTARGVDSLESTVEISQTLERGRKRSKRTALATRAHEVALAEFAVKRADALAATASAYVTAVVAQQRLALAAPPLQLARDTLAAIESRERAGVGSPVESARARAAWVNAQAEFTRRETALATARAALAAHWVGDANEVNTFHAPLTIQPTPPHFDPATSQLATHPRLEWQRALVANRRAALELEQSQSTQDVSVAGGVRFLRETSDAALVAGISVPLPVRHKNQGNIRAARETLASAELTTTALETELRIAATAAWQELAAAHRAITSLRRDALPATEEALAVVRRAYTEGHLPLIDVFDAQRELVALRREILDQESAYAHALVRFEALTNPTFPATRQLLAQP